jgi:hypothetical protein
VQHGVAKIFLKTIDSGLKQTYFEKIRRFQNFGPHGNFGHFNANTMIIHRIYYKGGNDGSSQVWAI